MRMFIVLLAAITVGLLVGCSRASTSPTSGVSPEPTITATPTYTPTVTLRPSETPNPTPTGTPTPTKLAPSSSPYPTNTPTSVLGDVISVEPFVEEGGRVDWYKGSAPGLIAYDAVSANITKNTEVYTIKPDGSDTECVTCDSVVPKGFVGQPAWHSDGKHLIIQVENENSRHTLFNHVSWGFDNDLWIVSSDGTEAELVWKSLPNHAALHSHFSEDGTKLIFAERIPTGKTVPGLGLITPGGENQWDGWQIHIADFDIDKKGTDKLSNHVVIKPNGDGFYETHQLTKDGRIVYSFTPSGLPYVDDVYICDIDGSNVQNLIDSPTTWDEHGTYSPSGRALAFNSSRVDPSWKAPTSLAITLETELYIKDISGEIKQITEFNATGDRTKRYITSDFDWDPTGQRIVVQVGSVNKLTGLPGSVQLWMITFSGPQ